MHKILVVDDEQLVRDEFTHFFQSSKYILHTASNSVEGLEKINNIQYDLVVLDIRMPNLNNRFSETAGIELLKLLKKEKPFLPVIMLSIIEDIKIAVDAMKFGARDYIVKDDFIAEEFLKRIDEIIKDATITLINEGETENVEFKSSLRYDLSLKKKNNDLGKVVAKSIAGFMNSNGGYLYIGITDSGKAIGIQNDIRILSKKTYDAFLSSLYQIVCDYLGKEHCQSVHPSFLYLSKKRICAIKVDRCSKPVWFKDKDIQVFYIRVGQSTRPLDAKEAYEYISQRFYYGKVT